MADTNPKTSIVRQKDALSRFRTATGELLDKVLLLADDKLHSPFEVSLSGDVITIGASEVQLLESDGAGATQNANKKGIQPEKGVYNSVAESTLNVDTGATTGDFSANPLANVPVVAASEWVWLGIEKRPDNLLYANWGTPNATKGSATYPTFSSSAGSRPILMVAIQDDGSGSSGSTWNFLAPVLTDFIIFETSGGAGGSGNADALLEDFKDLLDGLSYEFLSANIFALDETDKTDGGNTTATYDIVTSSYEFTGAGQVHQSIPLIPDGFNDEVSDITQAFIQVVYDTDNVDPAPTIEVSKDNGVSFDSATLSLLPDTGTYEGEILFTEPTPTIFRSIVTFNGTHGVQDAFAQRIIPVNSCFVTSVSFQFADVAGATGTFSGKIVKGVLDGGFTKPLGDTISNTVLVDASLLDNAIVDFNVSAYLTKGETYFVLVERVSGSGTVTLRTGNPPDDSYRFTYNTAGIWYHDGRSSIHRIYGWESQLVTKITSSVSGPLLKGIGVFYQPTDSYTNASINKFEKFTVSTNDNQSTVTDFLITKFLPDPNLVEVFVVETGQVFKYGAFSLNGYTITFPVGFFYDGQGSELTIIVDQNKGSVIDSSDSNRALLAANHLGSTDSSIDQSLAGRGIYLRRPDGTLREITIDNDDNIQIYSI